MTKESFDSHSSAIIHTTAYMKLNSQMIIMSTMALAAFITAQTTMFLEHANGTLIPNNQYKK